MHEIKKEGKQEDEITTWVFQGFTPVAKIQGDKSYSIISDHLGTPLQAIIDTQGNKVWERTLDIYGRVRKEKGEKGFCCFLFQGQYLDTETELVYNYKRYYSQETGAYISQDPIGLAGNNPTLYGYVEDTNIWLDIFGLACHHIATNKHREWSEKFRDLFKQYGIGKFKNGKWRKDVLNDPRNKVQVDDHKGPIMKKDSTKVYTRG